MLRSRRGRCPASIQHSSSAARDATRRFRSFFSTLLRIGAPRITSIAKRRELRGSRAHIPASASRIRSSARLHGIALRVHLGERHQPHVERAAEHREIEIGLRSEIVEQFGFESPARSAMASIRAPAKPSMAKIARAASRMRSILASPPRVFPVWPGLPVRQGGSPRPSSSSACSPRFRD